ncbi:MAG: ribonuclease HII [Candidatus Dactylopiibacterium carminicum]|uniref:Ribonuclease HII n=1 Tax=Candidatus Dactylopiibacterium carminicum TaxID=857335 RepID=A0A272EQD1_9RHOO|nr:ribonuclease HII [Candidatus Dactylopiibacterium carminicum]KAF7598554.1 ribonuclease HII [Candidatus Dactylopiibacterium carminicum]PAS92315.1 MAG: ribonuclease HII [Candidatus Dactylopiibacterium carminicum]PAS95900.1 MAG: ribonuclease HII [Candidatus Dactylopiibacterium carminicum]PAS98114.1 MAG: ribonuclease HII [Candidatus Dactylopiibacterium carminicum]
MTQVLICGVDEAGRGPLCGAVVTAAVILDPLHPIPGLADSKKLSAKRREQLAEAIREQALAWAVAEASVEEIDRLNILHATMLAMQRAVARLSISPHEVLIDGNRVPPGLGLPARAIVKGDATEPAISAASILAKTHRDAQLAVLDLRYPQYGFAQHKGYPTAAHLAALARYGATPEHRRSFGPVAEILAQGQLFGEG